MAVPTRPLSAPQSVAYGFGNLGAQAVYAFLNQAVGLYLNRYPEVPTWAVGVLSQERSLAGAVVQPVVGAMSDRTRSPLGRRRPYFMAGAVLTAAALLYLASYPPIVPMLLVLAVNAFFLNVAVDPYTALMADIVPPSQRGRIGTVLAIFNMVGQIVATLLGVFLWDRSPELVFGIVAGLVVGGFAVTTLTVREPPAPPAPKEPFRLDVAGYLRGFAAHRELLKYVAAAFVFWLGTGGVLPYLTRFGVEVLGTSEGEAFQLFLPALAGTIVGAIPAGILADRRGKKPVLAAGVLAFGLVALVASQVQNVPQALVAMAFVGLANGFWTALNMPLLVDLVPPDRAGEVTGLGSGVWSFAQPIGALIAGLLIDASGTYRAAFVGAAILVIVSFLLLLTVRTPRHAARGLDTDPTA
ncbi:MAG TPA: MFS transporter [Candidatus Limnocylindria bacterium]|nr:MFS transporter [Candidatus Limnocylindria bacterium]